MSNPDVGLEALRRWCYAVPGAVIAAGDAFDWPALAARAAAATIADTDVEAALAWILAAYRARRFAAPTDWQTTDLLHAKAAVMRLISAAPGNVRMSDAGLLTHLDGTNQTLTLNALWYSALAMLAEELRTIRDPQADHFDRLAGRFRRSFAKWTLDDPTHESGAALLLITLPFSPIARTRQRQIAAQPLGPTDAGPLPQLWQIEALATLGKPAEAIPLIQPLGTPTFPTLDARAATTLLAGTIANSDQLAQAEATRIRHRFTAV